MNKATQTVEPIITTTTTITSSRRTGSNYHVQSHNYAPQFHPPTAVSAPLHHPLCTVLAAGRNPIPSSNITTNNTIHMTTRKSITLLEETLNNVTVWWEPPQTIPWDCAHCYHANEQRYDDCGRCGKYRWAPTATDAKSDHSGVGAGSDVLSYVTAALGTAVSMITGRPYKAAVESQLQRSSIQLMPTNDPETPVTKNTISCCDKFTNNNHNIHSNNISNKPVVIGSRPTAISSKSSTFVPHRPTGTPAYRYHRSAEERYISVESDKRIFRGYAVPHDPYSHTSAHLDSRTADTHDHSFYKHEIARFRTDAANRSSLIGSGVLHNPNNRCNRSGVNSSSSSVGYSGGWGGSGSGSSAGTKMRTSGGTGYEVKPRWNGDRTILREEYGHKLMHNQYI